MLAPRGDRWESTSSSNTVRYPTQAEVMRAYRARRCAESRNSERGNSENSPRRIVRLEERLAPDFARDPRQGLQIETSTC
jgi:hypothetical protein